MSFFCFRELLLFSRASSVFASFFCFRELLLYSRACAFHCSDSLRKGRPGSAAVLARWMKQLLLTATPTDGKSKLYS